MSSSMSYGHTPGPVGTGERTRPKYWLRAAASAAAFAVAAALAGSGYAIAKRQDGENASFSGQLNAASKAIASGNSGQLTLSNPYVVPQGLPRKHATRLINAAIAVDVGQLDLPGSGETYAQNYNAAAGKVACYALAVNGVKPVAPEQQAVRGALDGPTPRDRAGAGSAALEECGTDLVDLSTTQSVIIPGAANLPDLTFIPAAYAQIKG